MKALTEKRRTGLSPFTLLPVAVAVSFLAACAGGAASNPGTTAYYATAFQGLKIRRIGNDTPGSREFQNRALDQALDRLADNGVSRDRIDHITVSVTGGNQRNGGVFSSASTYRIWIDVKGCAADVMFQARASGSITTVSDKSHCLSEA